MPTAILNSSLQPRKKKPTKVVGSFQSRGKNFDDSQTCSRGPFLGDTIVFHGRKSGHLAAAHIRSPSPVPAGVSALLSAGLPEAQCGRQWLKEEPQSLDCLVCDDRISTIMLLEQILGVLCPRFLIICKTNLRVSNVFSTNGRGKRMKGALHAIPR